MLAQKLHDRRRQNALRLFALRRAFFVEKFGHHDGDEDSRPVRDGISKERADVCAWVGVLVENDPEDYDYQRRNA